MFEAVQFIEVRGEIGPTETSLGEFSDELEAVGAARAARARFAETEAKDYAWWIVRETGARLANFISDSTSNREFVLDLSSGELVEMPS